MTAEFNINEKVRVRLTDHGRSLLRQQHAEFWSSIGRKDEPYTPPTEDTEGWSEWQLWSLMQDLGPHCGLGLAMPFETTIQFIENKPYAPPPQDPMDAVRAMCG